MTQYRAYSLYICHNILYNKSMDKETLYKKVTEILERGNDVEIRTSANGPVIYEIKKKKVNI